ncbi:hypothetical protein MCOR14_005056 [Pyricularia oryzae]|nr:hypothetical protein MCOR04_005078 [Pyricularia oryzae]KAI6636856.1 hypothetical protein MCOR14_005056 [Pyricularia oryzae]
MDSDGKRMIKAIMWLKLFSIKILICGLKNLLARDKNTLDAKAVKYNDLFRAAARPACRFSVVRRRIVPEGSTPVPVFGGLSATRKLVRRPPLQGFEWKSLKGDYLEFPVKSSGGFYVPR